MNARLIFYSANHQHQDGTRAAGKADLNNKGLTGAQTDETISGDNLGGSHDSVDRRYVRLRQTT